MKRGFGIVLLLLGQISFAQLKRVNFSSIDWNVQNINAPTPDSLARKLADNYPTQLEKVRSIFRWVTEHIAYKTIPKVSARYHYRNSWEDTTMDWRSGEEMYAWAVMQKRTAFCEGYARLFKTLCSYAGLQAEVITGYARTDRQSRFFSNHAWNAVKIDSSWYLLDATWASGFISYRTDEFVKAYDDYYFLTPPEQLIRTHYPEDIRWALLNEVPRIKEFERTPFRHSNFIKYTIASYSPSQGSIEAQIGDTLRFELTITNKERDEHIGSNPFFDTTLLEGSATSVFLQPAISQKHKIVYLYPVTSVSVQWLHLIYNDDVVLQYRLNIKPKTE
jgi:hypothetical protein